MGEFVTREQPRERREFMFYFFLGLVQILLRTDLLSFLHVASFKISQLGCYPDVMNIIQVCYQRHFINVFIVTVMENSFQSSSVFAASVSTRNIYENRIRGNFIAVVCVLACILFVASMGQSLGLYQSGNIGLRSIYV